MTTGTTGELVPFRFSSFDRVIRQWYHARELSMVGVRPNDLVMYCAPFMTHVFTWNHYCGHELAKIPILPAGPPLPTETRVNFIKRYEPTVLMGTPTYMIYLGEKIKESGTDPRETSVRLMRVGGEPGGSLLSVKRRIMGLWDANVCDGWGSTEGGGCAIAVTCEYESKDNGRDSYLHYTEDGGIPETIDPKTFEPLPEGEYGMLVWSALNSVTSPILRFNSKDISNIRRTECPCGRTLRVSEGGGSR